MTKTIKIFGRAVGDGHPTLIIAEIGLNHNGDIEIAKKLIDVAVEAGCDVVKFQKRHVASLATKEALDAPDNRFPAFGKTYREVREFVEFSEEEFKELKRYAESKNILFFVTPFDIPSAQMLERIGVDAYKSASHNLTYIPLLEHLAKQGKPMIVSTGMATLEEVDLAVELLKKYKVPFALLHCVSSYPTAANLIQLKTMDFLRERYGVPVGYSGHEDLNTNHLPTLAAVARGACIVERHITLDNNMMGFDHKISANPVDLKRLVREIRLIEQMMGDGTKKLLPEELVKRNQQRVSIVAARTIKAGEKINADMLCFKGPGTGLACYDIDKVLGKVAKTDISEDTLVQSEHLTIDI